MDRRQLLCTSIAGVGGLMTRPLGELINGWRTGRYARVGDAEVAELVNLAGKIRAGDARTGGGSVLEQGIEAMPWAKTLLDARPSAAVRERLHHAVARLAEQVGFTAADAGQRGTAQRCWRRALEALDGMPASEDFQSLRTRIHASLARAQAWSGDHEGAKAAAEAALSTSEAREPSARALGWATSARVHAARGSMPEALEAIDRAEELFRPGDDAPEWLAFSTNGTFLADTGHALCDLVIAGHRELTRDAENRMLEAMALLEDTHTRTRTLAGVVEVRMLAVSGQVDYAVELGHSVLGDAVGLQSQRVATALWGLRADLPDSVVVADLRRQIDAVLAAA